MFTIPASQVGYMCALNVLDLLIEWHALQKKCNLRLLKPVSCFRFPGNEPLERSGKLTSFRFLFIISVVSVMGISHVLGRLKPYFNICKISHFALRIYLTIQVINPIAYWCTTSFLTGCASPMEIFFKVWVDGENDYMFSSMLKEVISLPGIYL